MFNDPELVDLLERAKLLKQNRPKHVSPYYTPYMHRPDVYSPTQSPQVAQQLIMAQNYTIQQQNEQLRQQNADVSKMQANYDLLRQKYFYQLKDNADMHDAVLRLDKALNETDYQFEYLRVELSEVVSEKAALAEMLSTFNIESVRASVDDLYKRVSTSSTLYGEHYRIESALREEVYDYRRRAYDAEYRAKELEAYCGELRCKYADLEGENTRYIGTIKSNGLALSNEADLETQGRVSEVQRLKAEIDALRGEKPEVSEIDGEDLRAYLKSSKTKQLDLYLYCQEFQAKYINLMLGRIDDYQGIEDIMKVYEIIMAKLDGIRYTVAEMQEDDYYVIVRRKDYQLYYLTQELANNNYAMRMHYEYIQELQTLVTEYDNKLEKASNAFYELQNRYKVVLGDNKALAGTLRELKERSLALASEADLYHEILCVLQETEALKDCVVEDTVDISLFKAAVEGWQSRSHDYYEAECAYLRTEYEYLYAKYDILDYQFTATKAQCAAANNEIYELKESVESLVNDNYQLAVMAKQYKEAEHELRNEHKYLYHYFAYFGELTLFDGAYVEGEFNADLAKQRVAQLISELYELRSVASFAYDQTRSLDTARNEIQRLYKENMQCDEQLYYFEQLLAENSALNGKIEILQGYVAEVKELDAEREKQTAHIATYTIQIEDLQNQLEKMQQHNQELHYQIAKRTFISESGLHQLEKLGVAGPNGVDEEKIKLWCAEYLRKNAELDRLQSDLDYCESRAKLQEQELEELLKEKQQLNAYLRNSQVLAKQTVYKDDYRQVDNLERENDSLRSQIADLVKKNEDLARQAQECKDFCKEMQRTLDEHILLPLSFLKQRVCVESMVDNSLDVEKLENNLAKYYLAVETASETYFLSQEYKRYITEYQTMVQNNVKQLQDMHLLLERSELESYEYYGYIAVLKSYMAAVKEYLNNLLFDKQELTYELELRDKACHDAETCGMRLNQYVEELKTYLNAATAQCDDYRQMTARTSESAAANAALLSQLSAELCIPADEQMVLRIRELQARNGAMANCLDEHAGVTAAQCGDIANVFKLTCESLTELASSCVQRVHKQTRHLLDRVDGTLFDNSLYALQQRIAKLADENDSLRNRSTEDAIRTDQLVYQLELLRTENQDKNKAIEQQNSRFLELSQRVEYLMQGSQYVPDSVQAASLYYDLAEKTRLIKHMYKDYFWLPRKLLKIYPFQVCISDGKLDTQRLEELIKHDGDELMRYLQSEYQYITEAAQKDAKISALTQENLEIKQLLTRFDEVLSNNQVISNELLASQPFADGLENGVFNANKFLERYTAQLAVTQQLQSENERLKQLVNIQNQKYEADLVFSKSQLADSYLKLSVLERENLELRKSKLGKAFNGTGTGFKFSDAVSSYELVHEDLEKKLSK